MILPEILLLIVAAYAAFWAFYVVLMPLCACAPRANCKEMDATRARIMPEIIILIPAHNMESVVVRCIDALNRCRYPDGKFRICVVADHCTDETAKVALQAGVRVLERDAGPAGKTFALAWALETLRNQGIAADLYVITDATAWVDAGFLEALVNRWRKGEEIIVGHSVVHTENQQWFAHCLGLTLVHRNLQNLSRERLGLSALIEGRGMAYGRSYIEKFGWSLALPTSANAGSHPTEDWRHGVRVVEHGFRVAFADDARVITPLRESLTAATQQGVRWERGRMANALTHGLRLLALGIRELNRRKVFAALDSIQPPVAILGAISMLVALAAPFQTSRIVQVLGFLPLLLVGLYGVAVGVQGRKEGIKLAVIAWAPVFVAWRSLAFVLAWGLPGRSKNAAEKNAEKPKGSSPK